MEPLDLTLLLVGEDPLSHDLFAALAARDADVERAPGGEALDTVRVAAPDLVILGPGAVTGHADRIRDGLVAQYGAQPPRLLVLCAKATAARVGAYRHAWIGTLEPEMGCDALAEAIVELLGLLVSDPERRRTLRTMLSTMRRSVQTQVGMPTPPKPDAAPPASAALPRSKSAPLPKKTQRGVSPPGLGAAAPSPTKPAPTPASKSVGKTSAKPTTKVAPKTIAKKSSTPAVKAATKPVVGKSVTPAVKASPKAVATPVANPAPAQPAVKASKKPVATLAANPAPASPAVKAVATPVAKASKKSAEKPAASPAPTQPVAKSAEKPAASPTPAQPVAKSAEKPAASPTPAQPVAKASKKPVFEASADAGTGPAVSVRPLVSRAPSAGAQRIPSISRAPGAPGARAMGSRPSMPSMPSASVVNTTLGMPSAPVVGAAPNVASVPSAPGAGAAPNMPSVPSAPVVGSAPGASQAPAEPGLFEEFDLPSLVPATLQVDSAPETVATGFASVAAQDARQDARAVASPCDGEPLPVAHAAPEQTLQALSDVPVRASAPSVALARAAAMCTHMQARVVALPPPVRRVTAAAISALLLVIVVVASSGPAPRALAAREVVGSLRLIASPPDATALATAADNAAPAAAASPTDVATEAAVQAGADAAEPEEVDDAASADDLAELEEAEEADELDAAEGDLELDEADQGNSLDSRRAAAHRRAKARAALANRQIDEGHRMRKQRRLGMAEAAYLKALKTLPRYPRAMAALVRVHLARRDGAEALRWAKQLVARQPNRGNNQLLLGDAYKLKGSMARARAAWSQAKRFGNMTARKRLAAAR